MVTGNQKIAWALGEIEKNGNKKSKNCPRNTKYFIFFKKVIDKIKEI